MTSSRYKTTLNWFQTIERLSALDNISTRTPDCKHILVPASAKLAAPLSNDEFGAFFSTLGDILSSFPITIKEIIDCERTNQVVVWATSEPKFLEKVTDEGLITEEWSYVGEYSFIFSFEEGGGRISRIVEFVDTKGMDVFMGLMARAKQNAKKLKSESLQLD